MLTKDAKTVLYHLYKEYCSRHDENIPRSVVKDFGSAGSIHASLFPDWSLEDIEDTLRELGREGFVTNLHGDNTIISCTLSDFAIATMENQKKEILISLADFIAKFIPLL